MATSLKQLYDKYKEMFWYLVFGGLTTIISIVIYWLFNVKMGINEHVSNVISWIIAVLFAFVTNRIWVFESKTKGVVEFVKQMVSFYGGRVFTFLIEEIILFIFITKLDFNSMLVKISAQVIVIVLNYVISKLVVFRK